MHERLQAAYIPVSYRVYVDVLKKDVLYIRELVWLITTAHELRHLVVTSASTVQEAWNVASNHDQVGWGSDYFKKHSL